MKIRTCELVIGCVAVNIAVNDEKIIADEIHPSLPRNATGPNLARVVLAGAGLLRVGVETGLNVPAMSTIAE
jgi:hypothetical protein